MEREPPNRARRTLRLAGVLGVCLLVALLVAGVVQQYSPAAKSTTIGATTPSGRTTGIIKAIKQGDGNARVAVVQLDDGTLVEAIVIPYCVVTVGGMTPLSIYEVAGYPKRLYMISG